MYIYTYIHIYSYTHTHTHTHTHTYVCTLTYIHTCIHVHVYIYIYYTHTNAQMSVYICKFVCVSGCVCVCILPAFPLAPTTAEWQVRTGGMAIPHKCLHSRRASPHILQSAQVPGRGVVHSSVVGHYLIVRNGRTCAPAC